MMRRNSKVRIKAHICGKCGIEYRGNECPECGRKNLQGEETWKLKSISMEIS